MSRLDPNTGSYHAESLNVSQILYDVNNPHMIAVKSTLTQSFLYRSCILPKKSKQKTVQTLLFICIILFTVVGSQL